MNDTSVRSFTTDEASPELLVEIRRLMEQAFPEGFTDEDWEHTIGGRHFVVDLRAAVASHVAVVERVIEIDERRFRTGYVEGVATAPSARGRGLGSRAMSAATEFVRETYELGALGTGRHGFYERLGWERWRGPSYVRRASGIERTEDEDDAVMVLRFGPSRHVSLEAPITCEERNGEDW